MELKEFNGEDFASLFSYARPIWLKTYAGVIPEEQIDFLLDKYFSSKALDSYRKKGYSYFSIYKDNKKAGFLAFVLKEDCLYLDKLYLVPECQGKHIAKEVFGYLIQAYKMPLKLNVNQNNTKAVQSYLHSGFHIEKKEKIPLEGNMVNYDYVMVKNVA